MAVPRQAATSSATIPRRSWLERLWTTIADRGEQYVDVPAASVPPPERVKRLASALLSERGEASGAAVARELHAALRDLDPAARFEFFQFLASGFLPEQKRLREAASAYLEEPSPDRVMMLAEASEPPRQELLRRMNMSPGGTAALIGMRTEILDKLDSTPALKPLDYDLRHLFASWFNRGFLQIRRIDWETPAAVLEKLIRYEAVHEIQGWEDLRRRLAPDRRCFGFFHPALPGEPLIFVEVALTQGLAAAVQPLLARDDDERAQQRGQENADTAIFYSISNCQAGLRGVSFGNFLIKQVVEELKAELPHLVRFSTLSPVPGFRRWLERRLTDKTKAGAALVAAAAIEGEEANGAAALLKLARTDGWWTDEAIAAILHEPLVRLCATYLTTSTGRGPADAVARFHLGNGARLERVNWLGNTAPRGIKESFGIMVNYLYDPDAIEENHEVFAREGHVVRSEAVDALMAEPGPVDPKAPPRPAARRRLLKA